MYSHRHSAHPHAQSSCCIVYRHPYSIRFLKGNGKRFITLQKLEDMNEVKILS